MFNFPGLFHFSNFSSCKNIQFLCYRCNIFFISQKHFPFVCLEFFFWSVQYLFPPASFCSCLCLIDFHVSMLESLKCWWSFLSFIFTVGHWQTNWKSWMPEWSSLTGRIPCGLRKASWLLLLKDPPMSISRDLYLWSTYMAANVLEAILRKRTGGLSVKY